jgi:acetolactate synthase small subunit
MKNTIFNHSIAMLLAIYGNKRIPCDDPSRAEMLLCAQGPDVRSADSSPEDLIRELRGPKCHLDHHLGPVVQNISECILDRTGSDAIARRLAGSFGGFPLGASGKAYN